MGAIGKYFKDIAYTIPDVDRHQVDRLARLFDNMEGMAIQGAAAAPGPIYVPGAPTGNPRYFKLAGETNDANSWGGAGYFQYSDNGSTLITQIDDSGYIFNEQGSDIDFRIEGDSDTQLFNLDAGSDVIAMGGAVDASFKLTVHGQYLIDHTATEALLVRKNSDGGDVFIVNTTNSVAAIGGAVDTSYTWKVHGKTYETNYTDLAEIADPGASAANEVRLFANEKHLINLDEDDDWHDLSAGAKSASSFIHDEVTLSDQGGLNIQWGAGSIFDALITGGSQLVSIAAQGSNQAMTASSMVFVYFDKSGGSIAYTTDPESNVDWDGGDFTIALVETSHNDILSIYQSPIGSKEVHSIKEVIDDAFHVIVHRGLVVSEHTGDLTWDVDQTAGAFTHGGLNHHHVSARSAPTMRRWFHNASNNWESDTNAEIDADNWDDDDDSSGVIANDNSKWYRSTFHTDDDETHWVYPQVEYANLNAALMGVDPTPPHLLEHLPKTATIVMRGNAAAFPTAGSDQWIDVRPMIGVSGGGGTISDHGNLAGLLDNDHTIYTLHSLADAQYDFLVASGADTFVKKTLAETGAILEADIDHGNIQGLDTGADHSYIDQDVTTSASPTFADVFVPDGGTFGISGNELLTFNAAGTAVFSGCSVGIGGAPQTALHVVGGEIQVDNNKAIRFRDSGGDYSDSQIYLDASDVLNLYVGGTTRIYVTGAGNTGFGVSDPDELVELYKVGTQLKLSGGAADYATFAVAADGALTITTVDVDGAEGDIILMPDGDVGFGIAVPLKNFHVENSGGSVRFGHNGLVGVLDFLSTSTGGLFAMRDASSTSVITLDARTGRASFINTTSSVGFGIAASFLAKVHIDQASTTANKPVLCLDQADIDVEFIRLIGTSEDGVADRSLVDVADMTTPGALVGWFQIYIQDDQGTNPISDGVYYVPFYAAPSA